jgi:hypothetical protein
VGFTPPTPPLVEEDALEEIKTVLELGVVDDCEVDVDCVDDEIVLLIEEREDKAEEGITPNMSVLPIIMCSYILTR